MIAQVDLPQYKRLAWFRAKQLHKKLQPTKHPAHTFKKAIK